MLKQEVKILTKQSMAYSLGDFINYLINILLFPVYIKMLTPDEYGILLIVNTLFATLLMMLLRLGLNDAFMRLYFDYTNQEDRKRLLGSTYYGLLIVNVTLFVPLYIFIQKIAWIFLYASNITPEQKEHLLSYYTPLFTVTLVTCFVRSFLNVPFTLLQTEGRAKTFAAISILRFSANLILKFIFVAVFRWNIHGIVMVDLITALFFTTAFLPIVWKRVSFKPDMKMLKELVSFGLPKVPHNLAHHLLNRSDTYILSQFWNMAVVGIYGVGYSIGNAIKFFTYAFNMAWNPYSYKIHKEKDAPRRIARLSTYHISFELMIAVFVSFFVRELFEIIDAILVIDSKWFAALPIVPLIAFAFVFQAAYFLTNIGISIGKKTKYYPLITGISLLISIAFNLMLIPLLGACGAGITAVISYAAMAGLALVFGQKFYKIPWEWKRIFTVFLVSTAVVFLLSETNSLDLSIRFPLKFVAFLAIPGVLWLLRFFNKEELSFMKKSLFQPIRIPIRKTR
jgi:O-antigen/teichoic acid export membrane protein